MGGWVGGYWEPMELHGLCGRWVSFLLTQWRGLDGFRLAESCKFGRNGMAAASPDFQAEIVL